MTTLMRQEPKIGAQISTPILPRIWIELNGQSQQKLAQHIAKLIAQHQESFKRSGQVNEHGKS